MTRRRNPLLVLGTFAILWVGCSGYAGVRPCESQVFAQAPEPAPQPEPTPAVEITAEIILPAVALPGTFTPVTYRTNGEKANVRLLFDGGADPAHVIKTEAGIIVTQVAGRYPVLLYGTVDGVPVYDAETLTVGDPPPPEPDKPLAELVTAEQAAALAKLYRGLALVGIPASDFWREHDKALADRSLTGHGATAQIRKRLDAVLADSAALKAELLKIADELAKPPGPTPPPVVEGKRTVIVLRETEDNTPAIGLLTTELRTGAVAEYIKANGHTLDILDDDNPAPIVSKLVALGVQEPALFILDASTGAVIHQQPMPTTAAEILAVIKAHGG